MLFACPVFFTRSLVFVVTGLLNPTSLELSLSYNSYGVYTFLTLRFDREFAEILRVRLGPRYFTSIYDCSESSVYATRLYAKEMDLQPIMQQLYPFKK
jgi:hypothetical protein